MRINLSDLKYRSAPFESFTALRELGPLIQTKFPLIGKVWLVTTYEGVTQVLKDDKRFCRDPRNAGRGNYRLLQLLMPGVFRNLVNNMIGKDEPDHRRLRTLVDQAFQRQSINDIVPCIARFVDEQLDEVERELANGGSVDLVDDVARPIPLAVICELLGLPEEDRVQFKHWFSSFSKVNSVWGIARVVPGLKKTMKYLRKQFEIVKTHPRPGLVTALVEAEQAGERLSDEELLSMVMLLLLAGHETTVHLLSTSIFTLLEERDVRESLAADWSQVGSAVDEMLRYNSSAQFAKPRFVTEDTELCGQPLRRGESVMPVLASANCDPARFERPHEFIIDRPKNYHMTFGSGPHVCLGLQLAKAETEITLQRLFQRFPDLQPAFDISNPDWSRRLGMRALKTLPVHNK